MRGLELSRAYYENCGAAMIHEQFPEIEHLAAAALTGSGSECYGFDDEVSRDHDFEPGFCLFLPGEEAVDRRTAFLLERAYAKLPSEFMGFHRQKMAPVGESRHGVFRLEEYYRERLGCLPSEMTEADWLRMPEYALAEAVNGEVFRDDAGELTRQRRILSEMPEDILRKKMAGHLLLMAQSGQYNYQRCLRHGEPGAAQLAVHEFAVHAMALLFLIHHRYMPYYKWSFRALRLLPGGEETAGSLEWMLTTENSEKTMDEKIDRIEHIAAETVNLLQEQNRTKAVCGDLEKHAYSVNDGIRNAEIRNLHILSGI